MFKENVNQSGRAGSIISGLAIGAVVGAGVTLLFAPQSGRKTRSLLGRKSRELQDQVTETYASAKKALHRKASQVSQAVEAGKKAMDNEGAKVVTKSGDNSKNPSASSSLSTL